MSGLLEITERFNELNSATLEQKLTPDNVSIVGLGSMGSVEDTINTKGDLTPVIGGGFSKAVTIGWRRLRLDRLFLGIPVIIKDDSTTTRQLVATINNMYGTTITVGDIVNNNLPAQADNATVTITASPDSLYLVGSFTLRFTKV